MKNKNRPPIIALDGNHRTGKGTHLDILEQSLVNQGYEPLILRGDGTRTGDGARKGDPFSAWWQDFKNFAGRHENEYTAWRNGACRLLSEAAIWLSHLPDNGVILFDRAGISRSQMTIKEGLEVNFETLYTLNVSEVEISNQSILHLQPDLTLFLSASTETLLGRLSTNDPKYDFRKRNIIASNEYFEMGHMAYDRLGLGAVGHVSADRPISLVAADIYDATMNTLNT